MSEKISFKATPTEIELLRLLRKEEYRNTLYGILDLGLEQLQKIMESIEDQVESQQIAKSIADMNNKKIQKDLDLLEKIKKSLI